MDQIRTRVVALTHEKAIAMAMTAALCERIAALREEPTTDPGALQRVESVVLAGLDDALFLIDEDAEVLQREVAALNERTHGLRG